MGFLVGLISVLVWRLEVVMTTPFHALGGVRCEFELTGTMACIIPPCAANGATVVACLPTPTTTIPVSLHAPIDTQQCNISHLFPTASSTRCLALKGNQASAAIH